MGDVSLRIVYAAWGGGRGVGQRGQAVTDARRVGPIVIMVVGVVLMVSAFLTTRAPSLITVGGVGPTTTCPVTIGVTICPTTTVHPTTTLAHSTTVRPTTTVTHSTGTAGSRAVTPTTADPTDASTSPTTSDDPSRATHQSQLAVTGSPSITLLLAGVALLMLGLALLLASYRHPVGRAHSRK